MIAEANKVTGWNVPSTAGSGEPPVESRSDEILRVGREAQARLDAEKPKIGGGVMGEFSGGVLKGIAQPLVRTGAAIEGGLDQTLGRLGNGIAGNGFVPTHTADGANRAADQMNPKSGAESAGHLVGSIIPYFLGMGEEEAGTQLASLVPKIAEHLGIDSSKLLPKVVSYLSSKALQAAPSIAKDTAIGTAQTGDLVQGAEIGLGTGTARGLTDLAGVGLKAVKGQANVAAALKTAQAAATGGNKALADSIRATMPFEDKGTRIDALRNTLPDSSAGKGGVAREGILGKSTTQYTPQDIQRGAVAHEFINGAKDPVAKIANVNQGIQDTSSKVDSFLDKNAAPANFADMRNYMETNKPSPSLQKDPGASEAYQRATDGALNTLYDTMKSSAKASGDFGAQTSGKDIRAARIAIDQQITKELGENAFGTPQYKGIKAAEVDTRNLLNRMSEDMLRYPGQMENLNKMNDFISSSKGRGVEVDINNPQVKASLEKTFGLSPTGEAAAQKLSAAHEKMSHLFDARDNMIDKYQGSLGKNKVQEAVAKNSALKTGIETAKRVVPFGIGTHL